MKNNKRYCLEVVNPKNFDFKAVKYSDDVMELRKYGLKRYSDFWIIDTETDEIVYNECF